MQVGRGLFHIQHSPYTWIAESFASSSWLCATAGKTADTEVGKGAFQEQKQTTHSILVHNHEELVVLNGIKRRRYWKMTWLLAQTCLIVIS